MFAIEVQTIGFQPQKRMKNLLAAIFCLLMALAHAQVPGREVMTDNGTKLNPDGTNKFETPIGLDLMGGNARGITIYPNPSGDYLIISVAGKPTEARQITITALTGKQVYRTTNRRENTFMLDTSAIPKGIYSIEVISGGNVYRKKWARQ